MANSFPPEPAAGLLRCAGDGDEAAFAELYRLYSGPAYTVAMRMLCQRESAEEVVQETFLALLGAVRGYRGDGPFWGWLRRLVVSKVLMRMRSERSRPRLVAVEQATPDAWIDDRAGAEVERVLQARSLEAALAALPPTNRAVVWLYDVEGWTHQEIAEAMGRSVSFSKSQLARAHARLRELLSEEVRDASGW